MRSLRKQWREIDRAVRGDRVSEGLRSLHQRDPFALAVSIINLVALVGAWVWWGGRIDQRVNALEIWRDQEQQIRRVEAREKVDLDALQTMQIAVIQTEFKSMKDTVERIDRKIPERAR